MTYLLRLVFLFCLAASLVAPLKAQAPASDEPVVPVYVRAKVNEGEGLYGLLRRYGLPIDNCHVAKFRELNGLSPKQDLQREKEYQLPLIQYAYNGKSIRSTIEDENMELARAIQQYNRARQGDGLQAQAYELSNELWVPYGLLGCGGVVDATVTETLATVATSSPDGEQSAPEKASKKSGYDIFGDAYREIERLDSKLAGQYFYLITGHGGPDPGAMAKIDGNTVCEDEYAYDVVLRMARHILLHGGVPYVIVRDPDDGIRDDRYLACDYDEEVWGDLAVPRDQVERLTQRTETVNALSRKAELAGIKTQYCVEVHVDSRHAERQTDLFFYYQKKSDASEDMAEDMRDALKRNYKKQGRSKEYEGSVRSRDLFTLREVGIPTIYIELGNIQHVFDQKRVLIADNREALARWLVEGILERGK